MRLFPRRSGRGLDPVALVLSASLAAGGCSALFVRRAPPGGPSYVRTPCTQSRAWPWVDTAIGAYLAVFSAVGFFTPCQEFGCEARLVFIPLGLVSLGYGLSAWRGHSLVTECREARAPSPPSVPLPLAPSSPAASPPR